MRRALLLIVLSVVVVIVASCSQKSVVTTTNTSYHHSTTTAYDYFFLEAVRLNCNGDYAGAFDLLRRCAAMDSLAPEVFYHLGSYYAYIGDDTLANVYLTRAVTLNPKNDTYHECLGNWRWQLGDYPAAIAAYEHLYDNNKSRTDVLETLLRLYQQTADYDRMLYTLERYEQVEGISEETTLTKLHIYQLLGDTVSGRHALEALCVEHPNDVNYKVLMGNWLLQRGDVDEARDIFTVAERTDPDNESVIISLYDFYRAVGEDSLSQVYRDRLLLNRHTATSTKKIILRPLIASSVEDYEDEEGTELLALFDSILRNDSTNVEIAELKSEYMYMKGLNPDSITVVLRQILALDPSRTLPRLQLMDREMAEENYEGLIALCQPALIYNPEEIAFCYFMGLAQYQLNDTIAALASFRLGVSRVNDDSDDEMVSDLYCLIGDIEHQLGHHREAYAAYDSCLVWKKDNIGCLNNYAYYLALDGLDLGLAEQMALKAITTSPNDATYLDTYAWVLFVQEKFTEAKEFIDRTLACLDKDHDNSDIYEHAGDIYAACDDYEKAVEYWTLALAGHPDNEAEIREKIKRYEK